MRLDKYVCKSTELNRAEVSEMLQRRLVTVDDKVYTNGAVQVYQDQHVAMEGELLTLRPFRYVLMHKPANTVCSNVDETYPSIFNFIDINNKSELHVVGRLDVDTTGLVLLTDDGSWTYRIITPKHQCEKVYRVSLRDPITKGAICALEQGVKLQGFDKPTLPARINVVSDRIVELTLTQGKFHQVKRMFRAVGNRVKYLHRERIGDVSLDVDVGQWRLLSNQEVSSFD